jgi:hypothetical protein
MLGRIALAVAGIWIVRRWRARDAASRPAVRKQRLQDQEVRWEGEGGATPTGSQVATQAAAVEPRARQEWM